MNYFVPKVSETVCITDDLNIAIKFSQLFNHKKCYLPVLEAPRITRPDASNEAIKINNAIAQGQPQRIIYGNINDKVKDLFEKQFPRKLVEIIDSPKEFENLPGNKNSRYNGVLKWGLNNLGVGLLLAIRQKKFLEIDESIVETKNLFEGDSGLLFVAEDRKDITSIIIANYAFAFGASLLFIDEIPNEIIRSVNDQFFRIYNPGVNVEYELKKIKAAILNLLPQINTPLYYCITFFTKGIPFGFAFPELPCSHIFIYPMLGSNLCNYVSIEQNTNSDIKVGLLIDPGEIENTEAVVFIKLMKSKNIIIRQLINKEATVNNAHLFLAAFPSDLILISSHSDEVGGYRKTYKYKDKENIDRELVIDEAIGYGWDPVIEKFYLTSFFRFVSLDGIDWLDEEKKKKYYVGRAIIDFVELKKESKHIDFEIRSEKITNVHSAMAYKMSDGIFIPAFHGLADERSPIIISNACSSWRKVSTDVIFAGARTYIGPIRDILNAEAVEFIKVFLTKHINRPLCIGLWRTQQELYDSDIRRPYLLAGTHFTKLKFGKSSPIEYLRNRLLKATSARGIKALTTQEEDVKEYSERFSVFLLDELNRLDNMIN